VCAPLAREAWWDLFIVIPVLQLSSSLAQPLINHSSATHRYSLSLSLWSPYRQPQPGRTPRGLSRGPPIAPAKQEGRASAFIYALGFERPGVKLMKMEEEGGEVVKGKGCKKVQQCKAE